MSLACCHAAVGAIFHAECRGCHALMLEVQQTADTVAAESSRREGVRAGARDRGDWRCALVVTSSRSCLV